MKNVRQNEILKIVQTRDVETQEQLLEELKARGFSTTQATISRDIKELHLVKEPAGNGAYRYAVVTGAPERRSHAGRLRNIFKEGVTSFDLAQNIVVVKTMPGLGSAAGAALDGMDIPGVVGSLAGDDTAILIMRTNRDAEAFLDEIRSMLD